ncbi:TetR/AcrR family transcriptional regulator, partial [Corynebacterium nasicanis]
MSTRRRLSTEERRAAILAAAREHFSTTSYPDASVPDIAAASGSSQSLVFHYFSSKAGLYAAVVEDSLRSLVDAPLPPGHSTRERISALLQGYLDALEQDHTLVAGIGEPEAAVAHRRAAAAALV